MLDYFYSTKDSQEKQSPTTNNRISKTIKRQKETSKMNILYIFKQKNSFTSVLLMGLVAILLAAGLMMLNHPPVASQAQMADLTAAQGQYSNIVGTALDACGLCHTATFGFNGYGLAYASSGKDFAGIEGQDSDGDGFTNIEEILALTFPGDAASKPAPTDPTPTPPPPPTDPTPTPPPPPAGKVVLNVNLSPSALAANTFTVGDEFDVEIMAQGADASSAIYGAQFKLNYDAASLEVVAGTLQPGAKMTPNVIALTKVDNGAGMAQLAYSLQGDVPGQTGDVVVATVRFRAIGASDGVVISVPDNDLILGTKEATSIPVSNINNLTVIIVGPGGGTKATVSGQVTMPGKPDHNGATVALQGTTYSSLTDAGGNFSIVDVDEGTYTIEATAPGHLRAVCSDKAVAAPSTQLNAVALVIGDVDGDNLIDITDATTIGTDFGTNNSRSDLNGDGTVNVLDLILMAQNYGITGPSVWTC